MLIIGTIGAIIAGVLLPTIALIMGAVARAFGGDSPQSQDDIAEAIGTTAKWVSLVAALLFIFAYVFFAFW